MFFLLERFPIYLRLRAPLDYPHHLCYNRFVTYRNVSLRINSYHHCCGTGGTGGAGGMAGENSTATL